MFDVCFTFGVCVADLPKHSHCVSLVVRFLKSAMSITGGHRGSTKVPSYTNTTAVVRLWKRAQRRRTPPLSHRQHIHGIDSTCCSIDRRGMTKKEGGQRDRGPTHHVVRSDWEHPFTRRRFLNSTLVVRRSSRCLAIGATLPATARSCSAPSQARGRRELAA